MLVLVLSFFLKRGDKKECCSQVPYRARTFILYALAIPILIKIGTLGLSVLVGTLFGPPFGQAIDLPSVGIYALLGIGPLLFVLPFWSILVVGETERRPIMRPKKEGPFADQNYRRPISHNNLNVLV